MRLGLFEKPASSCSEATQLAVNEESQGNFSCSLCPQVATCCCLCSPTRTYLCSECISKHTERSTHHPIVSVTIPVYVTKTNLEAYFKGATALKKVTGELETLASQLAAERERLDLTFASFYSQLKQRLYEACSAVYLDIARDYEALEQDINSFKCELSQMEVGHPVSERLRKYVERGFHLPQEYNWPNIGGAFSGQVSIAVKSKQSLPTSSSLESMVTKWNLRICDCSNCLDIRQILSITSEIPSAEKPVLQKRSLKSSAPRRIASKKLVSPRPLQSPSSLFLSQLSPDMKSGAKSHPKTESEEEKRPTELILAPKSAFWIARSAAEKTMIIRESAFAENTSITKTTSGKRE